jgi:ubiquinone/menaquinone biosynthesis C-methylase UbiE
MTRPDVAQLFSKVSATYDSVGVPWFTPIAERLVAEVGPRPGERAVDLGCGRGAATRPLADAVGPAGRVVASDLAVGMVERTAADLRHLSHVEVRVDDASDPDLPPGKWDVVVASLVLFFLPDPQEALRRWARLLAPGGRLGVSTFGAQHERWRQVDDLFTPYLPQGLKDARTSGRAGPFSSDEGVEGLLEGAGLTDVRTVSWTLDAHFADLAQWEAWSRSHGQRAMWDAVPEAEQPALVARAGALFGGDLRLSQVVRCTLGRSGPPAQAGSTS